MRQIIRGAEPFFFPGGKVGCLLTHGFTASPQEVRELGAFLARQGHTVLGVRLSSHGTNVKDMNRSRWHDWLASVEDGYEILSTICEQVIAVGFSVGGALSLLQSARREVRAVAALSTPYRLPPDPRLKRLRPILRPLSFFLHTMPKGSSNWYDPQAERARVAYKSYPLRAILEVDSLLSTMREALPNLNLPVLLMHSKNDIYIPPEHMTSIYDDLGSKEKHMVWVERSNHIITCDAEREVVFKTVAGFVLQHVE